MEWILDVQQLVILKTFKLIQKDTDGEIHLCVAQSNKEI